MVKCLFMLVSLLSVAGTSIAQVVEERTTIRGGMVETCGQGAGLDPCRDIDSEPYDEEMTGPDLSAEDNEKMAEEAKHIRNESPEELKKTISELEKQ